MKYKKLLNSLSHHNMAHKSDSTIPIIALIAGMAAGAALSILFAPKKGSDTRNMISDSANELSNNMMQKFQDAKKRLFKGDQNQPAEIKSQVVQNARKTAKKVSDQLKGPEAEQADPSKIKVPTAGTTAWKDAQ